MIAKLVEVLENEVEGFVEVDAGVDTGFIEIWKGFVEVAKGVLKDICSFVADCFVELFGFILDVCG